MPPETIDVCLSCRNTKLAPPSEWRPVVTPNPKASAELGARLYKKSCDACGELPASFVIEKQ